MENATESEIDAFYHEVGRRIRKARDSANMTQLALSSKTGLTRSSIANLESGRQRVQAHVIAIIATSLGINFGQLMRDAYPDTTAHSAAAARSNDLERISSTARSFVEAGLRTSTTVSRP